MADGAKTTVGGLEDGAKVTVGGIIADKTIKYTKNNTVMAFIKLEDLVGSIEVIVFSKQYEKYADKLKEDNKIFIQGRVSVEEEKDAKLICEKIEGFDEIPRKLWLKFADMAAYQKMERQVEKILNTSEGADQVIYYIEETKQIRKLPPNKNVRADAELLGALEKVVGKENVKVR